ncbi:hypothetical protein F4861DRAFT_196927 [Xylaria intraflava]|nr:hypothetical protein F4861DRAFT_196927 [Xylaria intraflava]
MRTLSSSIRTILLVHIAVGGLAQPPWSLSPHSRRTKSPTHLAPLLFAKSSVGDNLAVFPHLTRLKVYFPHGVFPGLLAVRKCVEILGTQVTTFPMLLPFARLNAGYARKSCPRFLIHAWGTDPGMAKKQIMGERQDIIRLHPIFGSCLTCMSV